MSLLRIKEFVAKHPWVSYVNVINYVNKSHQNGLDKYDAVIREYRKVFINEAEFMKWVMQEEPPVKRTYLHYMSRRSNPKYRAA